MNLRHAAALALVGWYLMLPPVSDRGFHYNASVPLSQRTIDEGFDSASECKVSRFEQLQQMEKTLDDPDGTKSGKARLKEYMEFYAHAQCTASDDPRLKRN